MLGWVGFSLVLIGLGVYLYFKIRDIIRNLSPKPPIKESSPSYTPTGTMSVGAPFPTVSGTTAVVVTPFSGTLVASHASPSGSMDQKQILRDLINQMEDIVKRHPFYSWSLMLAGVELLGTFLDTKNNFFISGKSEERFKEAITQLFPASYQTHQDKLYRELRCGVNHYTLPKQTIVLSERVYGKQNLSLDKNGNLILVAEDFFEDFKNACLKVIQLLDQGKISAKIYHQLV